MDKKERADEFMHEVEEAVEQLADKYTDLGIYLEKDFRGSAPKLAVRIRIDRSGGIISRQEYEPITKKTGKK